MRRQKPRDSPRQLTSAAHKLKNSLPLLISQVLSHALYRNQLSKMTNPYEADPEKIPTTDLYADVPFYGRYYPKPDDFHVDYQHINSSTPESLRYWTSVISLCTEENRIYPADAGGRDVFALGSIIVKSSHLHARRDVQFPEIDFSYADANEARAIALAKTVLGEVKCPEILFAGKVIALPIPLSNLMTYVRVLRSIVVKRSSKKGFRVLDCLLHGLTCRENKGIATRNRLGGYSVNSTQSSQLKTSKLALTSYLTLTYSVTVGLIH